MHLNQIYGNNLNQQIINSLRAYTLYWLDRNFRLLQNCDFEKMDWGGGGDVNNTKWTDANFLLFLLYKILSSSLLWCSTDKPKLTIELPK